MKKAPLKIAIAQMNPTVGDYSANSEKVIDWIDQAERKNADIIVFPECALCGYPVWDLANKKLFVAEGLKQLKRIVRSIRLLYRSLFSLEVWLFLALMNFDLVKGPRLTTSEICL